MALPARTTRLTDAVFRAFGEADPVVVRHKAGGETTGVRVTLRRPVEALSLWQGEVATAQPFVQIPVADAPALRKGDILASIDDRLWEITEAPVRPGDGRKWTARVQDAGAAT